MPHRAMASSRPSAPLRTIGAWIVGKDARHRRQIADVSVHDAEQRDDGSLVGGDRIEIAHCRPLSLLSPHTAHAGANIQLWSLTCGACRGTGRSKRPGRSVEQTEQLFWNEPRP